MHTHTHTQALGAACDALSPREAADLLSVAADKGVRLRVDVMEVMLQELADASGTQAQL